MSLKNLALDINLAGVLSKADVLADVEASIKLPRRITLPDGTVAGAADRIVVGERTLAASANDDLDLAGGLNDAFGAPVTFVKLKLIIILPDVGNTNDVVLKPGNTNPFTGPFSGTTPAVQAGPGGAIVLGSPKAGWAVTPTTGDMIRVSNSGAGTSVKYRYAFVGTSA